MNTPTHSLINWVVARPLGKWLKLDSFPRSAVLLGSVAPDLPLFGLSLGGAYWFGVVKGWPARDAAEHMFKTLFYEDPVWISLHNFFHSPTMILMLALVWFCRCGKTRFKRSWVTWFLGSCLLHTLVDIPVHHDDGPLVFWPLQWSYRFASPVSYWDPNHFGKPMMVFEAILFVGLLVQIIWQARRKTRRN